MMKERKMIPKRRIRGYSLEWERLSLLNNVERVIDFRGRTPKKLGLKWSESGYLALSALNVKNGYIDYNVEAHYGDKELYDKWMKNDELKKGQVLFTTEAPMGNVAQVPDDKGYILSQRTIAFVTDSEVITDDFLAVILRTKSVFGKLLSLSSGGTAQGVSQRSLESLLIKIPTDTNEQQKIGEFFKVLDERIANQERKIAKVKALKEAYLTEMFPQEGETVPKRRFKGFEGEWEKFSLEDLGNTFSGMSGKTKSDFGHGEAKFVTYVNVFNNPISDEAGLEQVILDDKQTTLKYGDILFTTSSETPEEVGMSSVWLFDKPNVYLNSFCFGFRPKIKIDQYFIGFLLRANQFRKQMKILAQGISRYNISKNKVMEIEILLPTTKEQQKIGAFFKNLDDQIRAEEAKLEKLKKMKEAYLEEMFV